MTPQSEPDVPRRDARRDVRRRRFGAAVAGPLAVIGAAAATSIALLVAWRSQLPEPLATHFDGSGRADGFSSWTANVVFMVILGAALPAALVVGASLSGLNPGSRLMGAVAAGTGTLTAALMVIATAGQRGLTDAGTATLPMSALLPGLAIAAVGAATGYVVVPRPEPDPGTVPTIPLDLGASERVVWISHRSGPVVRVVGGVLVVAAVLAAVPGRQVETAAGLLVGGLITLTFATAEARVDRTGLTVHVGLFKRLIPLERITTARAVDVHPTEYGGWGYRLSRHGQAIVMGAGPGLTISRTRGTDLTITVPDATTGAALLTALLQDTVT